MSIPRFAGWGALGGLLFSGLFVLAAQLGSAFLFLGPIFAVAGAASAAGTLAIARKAEGLSAPAQTGELGDGKDHVREFGSKR
jgi:hypothetical protein